MEISNIETGVQLFSRLKAKETNILDGLNPKLFPSGGPLNNQVIEVSYTQGIDYTDFFIDFIARAVLPSNLDSSFKESEVLLLNTDFQINLFKLIKFLEHKLKELNVVERKSVVESCIKRVVILNCYSFEQLEATFYNLERIISNCSKPSLVVLDNCLSQYWSQKLENPKLSFDKFSANLVGLLFQKIKDLNVVLMYGKMLNNGEGKPGSQVTYMVNLWHTEHNFCATVNDLDKKLVYDVKFKVHFGLEFE